MNLSDLLSYTALIVAIYGAILSTYIAITEFFRLKLSYLDKHFFTFATDSSINNHGESIRTYDNNNFTFVILVRITNKSKNPTTISEFVLNNNYHLNSFTKIPFFVPTSFRCCNFKTIATSGFHLDNTNTLQPLIELKPLSSCEGYLVFNDLSCVPKNVRIKVCATQKSKIFNLKLCISNDCRNAIEPKEL